tara:strand:+ start:1223 stop:1417 length:195 start_codon:yes stop_codon:yes gene_type:complete
MLTKSIRIQNIKNLTIIIKNNKRTPLIKKTIDSPTMKTKNKNVKKEVIACDDEYIKKIIKNGGL